MKLGLLLLFNIVFLLGNAQTFDYKIKLELNEPEVNQFDTTYSHTCILNVSDTSNIGSIEIKGGKTQGQTEFVNHVFTFDQSANLPNGYTYNRHGGVIQIGLGDYASKKAVFYQIRVKDTTGNYSQPIYWEFKN